MKRTEKMNDEEHLCMKWVGYCNLSNPLVVEFKKDLAEYLKIKGEMKLNSMEPLDLDKY